MENAAKSRVVVVKGPLNRVGNRGLRSVCPVKFALAATGNTSRNPTAGVTPPLRVSGCDVRVRIVELVDPRVRLVQEQHPFVAEDAAIGLQLNPTAIHGPRRRSGKVDPIDVVLAAVTGTMENVLRWQPVRCATQMGALGVNHEQISRIFPDPDSVRLQKLLVHPIVEIAGITDIELRGRLKEGSREKISQEHEEVDAEIAKNAGKNHFAPAFIDDFLRLSVSGNRLGADSRWFC
jgi:hypothetical protein